MMLTCAKGHDNPRDNYFCSECGIPMMSATTICAQGHIAPRHQNFCGACGAPVKAPVPAAPGAPRGRWGVDPSARHQYRFWDGNVWTEHVADNGTLRTSPRPKSGVSSTERWVGIAAGGVTVVLLAGAFSAIATQFSHDDSQRIAAAPVAAPVAPAAPTPPTPSVAAPPDDAAPWPVAVIGAACRQGSNDGVTGDGSIAFCVNVRNTESYLWSLFPGPATVSAQSGGQPTNPSIAVCMDQTERSESDCIDYLKRPSDPGDGPPPAPSTTPQR